MQQSDAAEKVNVFQTIDVLWKLQLHALIIIKYFNNEFDPKIKNKSAPNASHV